MQRTTNQTPPTRPADPVRTLQRRFETTWRARRLPYTGSTLELRGSPRSHHCKGKGSLPLFRSTTQHLGTPHFARRRTPISIRTSLDALFTPPMSDHPPLTSQPSLDTLNSPPPRNWLTEVWIHITRHVGVGLICAVAYFDPCVSFPAPSVVGAHPLTSIIGETGVSIYKQAQTLGINSSLSSYYQASLPWLSRYIFCLFTSPSNSHPDC